eukprot:7130375-Alexandrium_andersonii.AAC.1
MALRCGPQGVDGDMPAKGTWPRCQASVVQHGAPQPHRGQEPSVVCFVSWGVDGDVPGKGTWP